MSLIQVSGVTVRRDADGRYSLNDLHKAAMANGKATESQRPGNFLLSDSVQAFAQVLTDAKNLASVVSVKGGTNQGTYADELVAIRYAAWIDPVFEVQVYQTFQAVQHAKAEAIHADALRRAARERARLECPAMTGALRDMRAEQGKTTAAHHYRNEADMLNRIVLGMAAADYRELHGVDADYPIRDHLSAAEIAAIEELQRFDSSLILMGMDYSERKARCAELFQRRHSAKIEAESIKRLN